MKKIFLSFILSILIFPCLFMFSACCKEPEPKKADYNLTPESIYQLVQAKGYKGSYNDFFLAIRGEKGSDGRGIKSITLSSSNNGIDTYTILYSDLSTSYFTITNGKDGKDGQNGQNGKDGKDGQNGQNGKDGKDGKGIISVYKYSSDLLKNTYRLIYTDGTYFDFEVYDGSNGKDGKDGQNGQNGKDGKDGVSITNIQTTENEQDNSSTITITYGDNKTELFTIYNGKDGKDGKGIKSFSSTTDNLITTYTITYTDQTSSTFTVTNGKDGTDGVGIKDINLNNNNELLITLTNNETPLNLGKVKGDKGENGEDGNGIAIIELTSSVNNIDTYTITFTDKTTFNFTVTNGQNGKDGKSIESIRQQVSETLSDGRVKYELIIFYSDGTNSDPFYIYSGATGKDGVGVTNVEKITNTDSTTITLTFGQNSKTETFTIYNGTDGSDGKDGRGIAAIAKTSSAGLIDTYTITYSDNSNPYTFTITNGKDGLSAYEIYKIYNPNYSKTEEDWILDLINGNLVTNRLTVTFDSNGGSAVESQSDIKYSGKAKKPINPTKEGYLFEGWFYQDEKWSFIGYSVTEDITLVAKWTPVSYTISFNTNGHGEFDSVQLTLEDNLTLPIVNINGYTCHWEANGEIITDGKWNIPSDTTINLILTEIIYPITYELNGGTNDSRNPSSYTITTDTITLFAPSKEGYDFFGWYDNQNFTGEKTTTIEKGSFNAITFYALFKNDIKINLDYQFDVADNPKRSYLSQEEYDNLISYQTINLYVNDTILDKLPIDPATPELVEGYCLAGWYYDSLLTQKVNIEDVITSVEKGEITLYAKWTYGKQISYIIEYYHQDLNGTYPSEPFTTVTDRRVNASTIVKVVATPDLAIETEGVAYIIAHEDGNILHTGFTYNYSQPSEQTIIPHSSVVFKLYYSRNVYTVTFDLNDGNGSVNPATLTGEKTLSIKYNDKYPQLPTPTRSGYEFIAWYAEKAGETLVVEGQQYDKAMNSTIYALWRKVEVSYIIEYWFENAGDEGFSQLAEGNVNYSTTGRGLADDNVSIHEISVTGYHLDLQNANNVVSAQLKGDGSSIVKLYYLRDRYQVSFDLNDNTTIPATLNGENKLSVKYNDVYPTLPLPTRPGYEFLGWYTEKEGINQVNSGDKYNSIEDTTLFAVWEEEHYEIQPVCNITFDLNDNEANPAILNGENNISIYYQDEYPTLPTPTRIGYKFVGWFTEQEGTNQINSGDQCNSIGDITLYAIWEEEGFDLEL